MEYIDNEIKRCEAELQNARGESYSHLYAVQQALKWALDPMSYATPVDIVLNDKVGTMDTQEDLVGCSAVPRLPLSSANNPCRINSDVYRKPEEARGVSNE